MTPNEQIGEAIQWVLVDGPFALSPYLCALAEYWLIELWDDTDWHL